MTMIWIAKCSKSYGCLSMIIQYVMLIEFTFPIIKWHVQRIKGCWNPLCYQSISYFMVALMTMIPILLWVTLTILFMCPPQNSFVLSSSKDYSLSMMDDLSLILQKRRTKSYSSAKLFKLKAIHFDQTNAVRNDDVRTHSLPSVKRTTYILAA